MSKKDKLTVTSEKRLDEGDDLYPKRFTVVIDHHPDDPNRLLVTRTVEGMSGFEVYGLLHSVLRAIEAQIDFPLSRRSDGIEIIRPERGKEVGQR